MSNLGRNYFQIWKFPKSSHFVHRTKYGCVLMCMHAGFVLGINPVGSSANVREKQICKRTSYKPYALIAIFSKLGFSIQAEWERKKWISAMRFISFTSNLTIIVHIKFIEDSNFYNISAPDENSFIMNLLISSPDDGLLLLSQIKWMEHLVTPSNQVPLLFCMLFTH